MLPTYLSLSLRLGKVRIAIPVSLSCLTGYLLAERTMTASGWWAVLGVFLLSMGASALNQMQERSFDARMERTKNRPLPSGQISVLGASLITMAFLLAGSLILLLGAGMISFLLGLLTIVWYNIIYTYLKRVTAFAVVPGSIVGALPPLIGWAASGEPILSQPAISLAFFFFIGQIPHFWLIILMIGPQYAKAGYPSLSSLLSNRQIANLTFIWALATGITALTLPLFQVIRTPILHYILFLSVIWLFYAFLRIARPGMEEVNAKKGFLWINLFFLIIMALVWIDVSLG